MIIQLKSYLSEYFKGELLNNEILSMIDLLKMYI